MEKTVAESGLLALANVAVLSSKSKKAAMTWFLYMVFLKYFYLCKINSSYE
ncbi:hypothetical protein FM107_01045 [Sphingobacterium sp. JB170]|nr:hypothetical protein FM107_01045 [Sphingobacterium sp. JB170]